MSLVPDQDYENPHGMRKHITWTATLLSIAWLTSFALVALTPAHRESVVAFTSRLAPLNSAILGLSAITVTAVLGYFLADVLSIHDTIYDRYVVGFKRRHDIHFILPHLLSPFSSCVPRAFTVAVESQYDATDESKIVNELFYEFFHSDPKLSPQLVSRYIRALTRYWQLQLTEVALLTWLLAFYLYSFAFSGAMGGEAIATPLIVFLMFIVNRLGLKLCRRFVREQALEVIRHIHISNDLSSILADRLHAQLSSLGLLGQTRRLVRRNMIILGRAGLSSERKSRDLQGPSPTSF